MAAMPDAELRRRLLAWYRRRRRDLPWRQTERAQNPYTVWVSEIMLQQTRVETVIPYYERFLARFPHVQSLAAAPLGEVLRLWSGLGYYRRARQLHAAARAIARRHGGCFPLDPVAVRALPGIGEYTAGAILSIAAGLPLPAVDGNAVRVLSRLHGFPANPRRARQAAARLISRRRPGEFNQALMDLGAAICQPRMADCPRCPLARGCRGAGRLAATAPARKRAKAAPLELGYALWRKENRVWVTRRAKDEAWMPGLWELPPPPANWNGPLITEARHTITRYTIRARLRAAPADTPPARGGRWLDLADLDQLPLTGLARKLLTRM